MMVIYWSIVGYSNFQDLDEARRRFSAAASLEESHDFGSEDARLRGGPEISWWLRNLKRCK